MWKMVEHHGLLNRKSTATGPPNICKTLAADALPPFLYISEPPLVESTQKSKNSDFKYLPPSLGQPALPPEPGRAGPGLNLLAKSGRGRPGLAPVMGPDALAMAADS